MTLTAFEVLARRVLSSTSHKPFFFKDQEDGTAFIISLDDMAAKVRIEKDQHDNEATYTDKILREIARLDHAQVSLLTAKEGRKHEKRS